MKKNSSKLNDRVGLFGGTFNPLHTGHIECILTTKEKLNLDRVIVIPAAQNPRKGPVEGPTDEQRVEILRRGLSEYEDFIAIDEQEIQRGGLSYTIETVKSYAEIISPENLYLIIGLDQFEELDKWKDFEGIMTLCNLAVATRPGFNLPFTVEDFPQGLQPLVAAYDRQFTQLTTDRHIDFVQLKGSDASSAEVRRRLRTGRGVDRLLSIPFEEYIREQGLYQPIGPKIGDYTDFVKFCHDVLADKKSVNVRAYDLRSINLPTEFTLIASGTSTRHASSLADTVIQRVKEEYNVFPQSTEGMQEGRWVLLDYGSLIVHVFYDFVRQEYKIEDLWRAGKLMSLLPGAGTAAVASVSRA